MKLTQFLLWGIALFPFSLLAATSDFTVRQYVGVDNTPPTVPTILSATPIAPTQIDVTWSVSTDDVQLAGYVLSRDGVAIATTTLTSFSDTGLTPETEYAYTVEAYDWVGNYSASSSPLSTTTPALPPPATTTPTSTATESASGQATRVVRLRDLTITSGVSTTSLVWSTTFPARFALRWGRSVSYELGFVMSDVYRTSHQTLLTDLEPGTTYEYELIAYGTNGIAQVLSRGQFATKPLGAPTLPANVSRLTAAVSGTSVALSWKNPEDVPLAYVRVLRNHRQYPTSPTDGVLVYQGSGEGVTDRDALAQYSPQYYTVFVVDQSGSVSSGAVVRAYARTSDSTVPGADDGTTSPSSPDAGAGELAPITWFPPESITITQAATTFTFSDTEEVVLSPALPFTISIPYAAAPPRLKSIIVTILDPTNQRQSYAFLLRLNKERTAYEATIAPLEVAGASRFLVEVFDYQTGLVGRYTKHVDFTARAQSGAPVIFPDAFIEDRRGAYVGAVLAFLLVGSWLWFFIKRRRKEA